MSGSTLLLLLTPPNGSPSPPSPSGFSVFPDGFVCAVAEAHTIAAGTLVLAELDSSGTLTAGAGTRLAAAIAAFGFPAISVDNPFRFMVLPSSAGGVVEPGVTPVSRYLATGLSDDTLTGLTAATGSTDLAWAARDIVTCYWDGGAVLELQNAIAAIRVALASLGLVLDSTTT